MATNAEMGFENDLSKWQVVGDAQIAEGCVVEGNKLTSAYDGKKSCILTNQNGYSEVSRTVTIPKNATTLRFDWLYGTTTSNIPNIAIEIEGEGIDPFYGWLYPEATQEDPHYYMLKTETSYLEKESLLQKVNGGSYAITDWENMHYKLNSLYQGKEYTIKFRLEDNGSSDGFSFACIDNIRFLDESEGKTSVGKAEYEMYMKPVKDAFSFEMPLELKVKNTGNTPIKLSDLQIFYYYTNDNTEGFNDIVISQSAVVKGKDEKNISDILKAKTQIYDNQDLSEIGKQYIDSCLTVEFSSGTQELLPTESIELKICISNTEQDHIYSFYNDYSYLLLCEESEKMLESGENAASYMPNYLILAVNDNDEFIRGNIRPYEYVKNTGIVEKVFDKEKIGYDELCNSVPTTEALTRYVEDLGGYQQYKVSDIKLELSVDAYMFMKNYELPYQKKYFESKPYGVKHINDQLYCEGLIQYVKAQETKDGGITFGYGTYIKFYDKGNDVFMKSLKEKNIENIHSTLYGQLVAIYNRCIQKGYKLEYKYFQNVSIDRDTAIKLMNYDLKNNMEVSVNLYNLYPRYFGYASENKTLGLTQSQYDSLVTWKYNRGYLPKAICYLVEERNTNYATWEKDIKLIVSNLKMNDDPIINQQLQQGVENRWLDQAEMYLKYGTPYVRN